MFTLRIVFVGLIAFGAAQSEHGVMLLTNDEMHNAAVVLREGTCSGSCREGSLCDRIFLPAEAGAVDAADPQMPALCWYAGQPDKPAELTLEDVAEEPLVISSGRTLVNGVPSAVPRYADEARDLSWVGSIKKVVLGPGPLRGGCQRKGKDCPAWARFWLPGGRLSACHFLHVPEKANKEHCANADQLLIFDVGDDRQALANATLLELWIPDNAVRLRMVVGEDVVEAMLAPTGDDSGSDDTVTLVVFNEPLGDPTKQSCKLDELSHFPMFRRFLDPVSGLLGKLGKQKPRWRQETLPGVEGACEEDIRWLASIGVQTDKALGASTTVVLVPLSFPEGASECDMATFP